MAKKNLPQGIINRLFGEYSEKRLVVVQTYDEFLAREDVRMMLTYASLRIAEGDSLALRLWWETTVKEELREQSNIRFVFVQREQFDVPDDIAIYADTTQFVARHIFPRYKWALIKDQSIGTLNYLYQYPGRVSIDELRTHHIIAEYQTSYEGAKEKIENIIAEWDKLFAKIKIDKPGEWLPQASALILRALEIGNLLALMPKVDELNTLFQQHLVERYASIISSTTPPANKAPKNVCQVLPFIGKQPKEDKLALVVVDGMNF